MRTVGSFVIIATTSTCLVLLGTGFRLVASTISTSVAFGLTLTDRLFLTLSMIESKEL